MEPPLKLVVEFYSPSGASSALLSLYYLDPEEPHTIDWPTKSHVYDHQDKSYIEAMETLMMMTEGAKWLRKLLAE